MGIVLVCGSDLHTYHGLFGGDDVPYIMGHEAVGVIVEVGKDVTDYKAGDRVVVLAGGDTAPGQFPHYYGFGDLLGSDSGGLQGKTCC